MEKLELIVLPSGEGQRLDAYLSTASGLSRSAVQNLCEQQRVWRNGVPVGKNIRLQPGDKLSYLPLSAVKLDAFSENIPLDIVFEDENLLVVNKPQGMVVHPAPGNPSKTLVNALMYHCDGHLSSINGVIRPGIVHRIDKDTSGLLVVAKNDVSHLGLSEQFAVHSIDRVYYAVVYGCPSVDEGCINAPLGRHPVDRKKMCITEKNSRHAVTHYQVLEQYAGFSLLRLRLETGRTHQIRVHMASIGHPVAGDPVYGPSKQIKGLEGQCLHAAVLGFIHPVTGERLCFEAPLPAYFTSLLSKLREGKRV